MNVALTGFMGAGKTVTGRQLARLLALRFVDTDEEIVRRHGPVAAIFASEGEPAFRIYETQVIEEVARAGPCVIAVGGGAVQSDGNRRRLRAGGFIVHLGVSAFTAFRRVQRRQHRPLLGPKPDIDHVRTLLAARAAAYADCDLTIHVDHKSPLVTAKIIARWYADRTQGRVP